MEIDSKLIKDCFDIMETDVDSIIARIQFVKRSEDRRFILFFLLFSVFFYFDSAPLRLTAKKFIFVLLVMIIISLLVEYC